MNRKPQDGEDEAQEERWKDRISHHFGMIKDDFVRNISVEISDTSSRRPVSRFKDYLSNQLRDLPGPSAGKFINHLGSFIGNFLHSSSVPDKLAALTAILLLIDLDDGTQSGRTITRVINWLRSGLESPDHSVTTLACIGLGKVVRLEGTLAAECAEAEVLRALKWAEGLEKTDKRYTGITMLKQLALNSPTCFFIHVKDFFTKMWAVFKDRSLQLRETAAECLGLALALIHQREDICRLYYRIILEEAQRKIAEFKDKRTEIEPLHGALLVVGCLLYDPGNILDDCFPILVQTVMQFKDHRDKLIRAQVIALVPRLAKANPAAFLRLTLEDSIEFLFASARVAEHEMAAFQALGETFYGLRDEQFILRISPHIDRTIHLLKPALQPRKTPQQLNSLYSCIELIAKTLGSAGTVQMHEILPLIFQSCVISSELADALSSIAAVVPTLLSEIQERLLNLISIILAQLSFEHFSDPSRASASNMPSSSTPSKNPAMPSRPTLRAKAALTPQHRKSTHSIHPVLRDDKTLLLALQVLGSFDFNPTTDLTLFVREVVLEYVDDDQPDVIRQQAATVAIQIAVHPGDLAPTTGKNAAIVAEIVEKLLALGVTDPSETFRASIFRSLDERYDPLLSSSENLQSLFLALNDENFANRSHAISIIGRLAVRNPVYVMPSLRKTLIQLVTELDFASSVRIQEECCRLLMCLIRSAGRLMRPYVATILAALIPKLSDSSQRVTPTILAACAELSPIASAELKPHLPLLFSLTISCLHDQGSVQKRLVALKALHRFSLFLGYVIQPYFDYPGLMSLLTTMLKTEHTSELRTELLAVLGVLGALDPNQVTIQQLKRQSEESDSLVLRKSLGTNHHSSFGQPFTPSMEFFSGEALRELTKILADPSLSIHHAKAVHIMMYICKLLGAQCGKFLPEIVPLFIAAMNSPEKGVGHDFLIQQVGNLIQLTGIAFLEYLEDVVTLIQKFWSDSKLVPHLLLLVEKTTLALKSEVKAYLPLLIPSLLTSLHTESIELRQKLLNLLDTLGENLDDYVHLVIPSIVKLFDTPDATADIVVIQAIETIGRLCMRLELSDYASRITHPLLRVLQVNPAFITAVMNTICMLVYQIGSDYASFIPLINRTLSSASIHHHQYETLVACLLKNQPMTPPTLAVSQEPKSSTAWTASSTPHRSTTDASTFAMPDEAISSSSLSLPKTALSRRKMQLNVASLRKAWETSLSSTREDWTNWLRRLSVEFLRESPAMALRSCLSLAQYYSPLARALFNAGFMSCWVELNETDKQSLSKNMKSALQAPNSPPEIIQTILDLAECVEHYGMSLNIAHEILGSLAQKSRAYAKALHYKELTFKSAAGEIESETIQALISINNMLGQPDAARGILAWAQQRSGDRNIQLKETWYESLHQWEQALAAYQARMAEDTSFEIKVGKMRCYAALGDWAALASLVQASWRAASPQDRRLIAPMAVTAVWNLGSWDQMKDYISFLSPDSVDGAFFQAILSLHQDNTTKASRYLLRARTLLDTDLTALMGESYHRAYQVLCRVQQLSELEEVAEYKHAADDEPRRAMLKTIWSRRLRGCERSVDVWQKMLPVQSLVLTPHENIKILLKYASLCRKASRMSTSHQLLVNLLGGDPAVNPQFETSLEHPEVSYCYFKHLWHSGSKAQALSKMKTFAELIPPHHFKLRSKVFLKLGSLELEMAGDKLNASIIPSIANAFRRATQYNPDLYRAWHAWGMLNFEAISMFEKNGEQRSIPQHLRPAFDGFFKSITLSILSKSQTLQDTLRLLTLWFKYGSHPETEEALRQGFGIVPIDNWLQVIPQIIARIHSSVPQINRLVRELLHQVGKAHPQALVYPLAVAIGSQSGSGLDAATELLTSMREHSENLVDQAMLVSKELIRVSIGWPEQWHEALEDASRSFFTDKNPIGMIERLMPMHQALEQGPQTLREQAFYASFARELAEARNWCRRYMVSSAMQDLNAAWDLYYGVFRGITRLLPHFKLLDLHFDSPQLLAATNLELAIPGSYIAGQPVIRIQKFHPLLTVFSSKQRPRKMTISGSNGKVFHFLLKGHEDLRQDERVMQLFGLINNLLEQDHDTCKYHLSIIRYAAVPLSPNSGLIGWVPNTDTLHDVIKKYRESSGIPLRCEQISLGKFYEKFDQLSLIQKVELFLRSLEASGGMDISQVLWQSSPNSEIWLERRTNYTRSLALMSMVGYILGLGDRHPSNLMIERHTGKVLHIDFGDCFEVAMVRDKYPETVPFRLTRMLVNAMEVSGIEGNFRSTCESVMRVLRDFRESLMAVLEAFVHDPLINWRLLATQQASHDEDNDTETAKEDSDLLLPDAAVSQEEDNFMVTNQDETDGALLASVHSRASRNDAASTLALAEFALNARAVQVIERVSSKLRGTDFNTQIPLDVPEQVNRLIDQARSAENLCLLYTGWSASW